MARGKVALGLTALGTIGVISYVHYDQKREIRRMREGVYLDAERERFRRKVLHDKSSAAGKGNSSSQNPPTNV